MFALLSLLIWLFLLFGHGRFWRSAPELTAATPVEFPEVDVIVPARDEAAVIGAAVSSLVAQRYAGRFRVTVVDDNSSDATAAVAGAIAGAHVIRGAPKPPGWSGKLWAVAQGIAATRAPVILLTDADIVHAPDHLATLVARLEQPRVELVSEMVRLNCSSAAERWLVPAFVYFFQMLYPFSQVNDPRSPVAAAAGGTILIRRDCLQRIGGIESIRGALIDDVTLARAVKAVGPVFLGHSGLAVSIRPYPACADLWRMIARSAFTQLRYSNLLLGLTLLGLTLVWLVPPWVALTAGGWRSAVATLACAIAVFSYLPTLARYRLSPLRALGLPFIAVFYMAATVGSAIRHWRGHGAHWKDRDYSGAARE